MVNTSGQFKGGMHRNSGPIVRKLLECSGNGSVLVKISKNTFCWSWNQLSNLIRLLTGLIQPKQPHCPSRKLSCINGKLLHVNGHYLAHKNCTFVDFCAIKCTWWAFEIFKIFSGLTPDHSLQEGDHPPAPTTHSPACVFFALAVHPSVSVPNPIIYILRNDHWSYNSTVHYTAGH